MRILSQVAGRDEDDMTDLSPKNRDLLLGIFHFGGYCNSQSATLATRTSRQNTLARLNDLVYRRYLRMLRIDFRRTTPHVFQVTSKTCRLFHPRDTYLSKNHPGDYIIRALLRYLFYVEHRSFPFIVDNEEKIRAFLEAGYEREMLPCKKNLSRRETQSARVYSIEELVVVHRGKIHLFFFDRDPRHVLSQLRVLLKSYERVLGLDHRKIRFHIVVGNEWRKAKYLRVLKRGFLVPVDRPDERKAETYEEFVKKITGTRDKPKDHLPLREIDIGIVQTKSDVFSRKMGW
jgi:hypothetical protein